MDNKLYRALTALLWLTLPLTGLQYWLVWDQLPARMATHFGASGQANGWMSRQASIIFSLVLTVFLLSTFTWVLTRIRKPDLLAWSLLAMLYVVIGSMYSINAAVLNRNLYGYPVKVVPVVLVIFLAAFLLIAVAFGTKRGARFPQDHVIAEEVHAGPIWALGLMLLTVLEIVLMVTIPVKGLRFALALPALLLLGVTALAWSGFHYRFTAHGIEISTLGFRLRSIPLQDIKSYAVDGWNFLGGYGIRGLGERRAYVWGNRGVRIELSDAEVFLGHNQPERLVDDLNLIRNSSQGRGNTQRKLT
jgi:Protein of unknown function (DUF1648)